MDKIIVKMGSNQIKDVNKPYQPFLIIGKIIPRYDNGNWTFEEMISQKSQVKNYSADEVDYTEYINNPDKVVYMCYVDKECIGQIRLRRNWNKYCYIEKIVVSSEYRETGIGKKLINNAISWAKANDMLGIMLETQDNNLSVCRFYCKCGFHIGAVDTMLYANFENNGEKAVFWYMKF